MTAVITKYKKDFDRWVVDNPKYPNPVHISCLEDIKDKYLFVKSISNVCKIWNYRIVIDECKKRLVLYVAFISKSPIEARLYNIRHKEKNGITIDTIEQANKYVYSYVYLGRKHNLPENSLDIMIECQNRCVVLP